MLAFRLSLCAFGLAAILGMCGCGTSASAAAGKRETTLTVAGFAVSRDVYEKKLLPAFERAYEAKHADQDLRVRQSYEGSGAQQRAILGGLNADVAALALAPEIDGLAKADKAPKDWAKAEGAFPASSVVVLAVRPGNPKGIKGWEDLARPDVSVLTPNPDTSGAAQWNITAIYGAAVRGGKDPGELIRQVRSRVAVYGKSGRESMQQFANGVGDVLITWENEALLRKEKGTPLDVVYPTTTLKMEPPVSVVRDGSAVAGEFQAFLVSPEAQRLFAEAHFRPRDAGLAAEFPKVEGLFSVEDLGGWEKIQSTVFGPGGLWARAAS